MTKLFTLLVIITLVTGCYVQARTNPAGPPPSGGYNNDVPPPPPPEEPPPPPPAGYIPPPQPAPGPSEFDRTPPPPMTPPPPAGNAAPRYSETPHRHHPEMINVTLSARRARRGSEVNIYLNPPRFPVVLYFNGRIIPKKVSGGNAVLTATIPANGDSGYFEIEWNNQRFRSPHLVVDP